MKRFLTRKELKVKRKQTIYAGVGIAIIVALYFILTHKLEPVPEIPIVSISPAQKQDVEIYGVRWTHPCTTIC